MKTELASAFEWELELTSYRVSCHIKSEATFEKSDSKSRIVRRWRVQRSLEALSCIFRDSGISVGDFSRSIPVDEMRLIILLVLYNVVPSPGRQVTSKPSNGASQQPHSKSGKQTRESVQVTMTAPVPAHPPAPKEFAGRFLRRLR